MAKKIKVVLLQPVRNLWNAYDVVEVSPPYFKNVLQRQGLATLAKWEILKKLEAKRAQKEAEAQHQKQAFEKMVQELKDGLILSKKATDAGNLYDKVDEREIAKEINHRYGLNLGKDNIKIPHKLQSIGSFPATIVLDWKELQIHIIIQKQD